LIRKYNFPEDKLALVPNGLKDTYKYISKKKKNQLRRELHFSQKEFIILYVGRLEEGKGISFLIKAFIEIVNILPHAKLLLIGGGEFFYKYLMEAKGFWNKIIFTGYLEKEFVSKFYQIADVGIIPSFNEQCSYVAIEMMMHGLPLVMTNTWGLSEMLENNNKQYVVEIQETEKGASVLITELKDKIINACNDENYKHRLRCHYENRFSINQMKKKYINILSSI
jgi:glycosyltransferase involved in cell wall biosynthesis